MAGGLSSSSSHLVIHHFLRPPPLPPSASSSILSLILSNPLSVTRLHESPLRRTSSFTSLPRRSLLSLSPSLSLSSRSHTLSTPQLSLHHKIEEENSEIDIDNEFEAENEDFELVKEDASIQLPTRALNSSLKLPSLSVKEKKEIASYAHSLGKKLKSQQVGKSGVTDSVAVAMIETLEANELLKIKIHNNCPGELDDAVKQLEAATGSVVVGQIGRTVILYRPSMTKLKAEEKKKQAQKVMWRRQQAFKPSLENKGYVPRAYVRGRRGSSRYLTSS